MKQTILFFYFILVLAVVAYSIPSDPNSFYGHVYLNGKPFSGVVHLFVNGAEQDNITASNGIFGGPGVADDKLVATGSNGDVITFRIYESCYNISGITMVYEEGKVEEITLMFSGQYVCSVERGGGEPANETNATLNLTNETTTEEQRQHEPPGNYTEREEGGEKSEIIELLEGIVDKDEIKRVTEEKIGDFKPAVQPGDIEVPDSVVRKVGRVVPAPITKVSISMIVVETVSGEVKKFLKVEKITEGNKPVIEVIPKEVASSSKYIKIIEAESYAVLEDDPILEITPTNDGKYSYVVLNSSVTEDMILSTMTFVEAEEKEAKSEIPVVWLGVGLLILIALLAMLKWKAGSKNS